MSHEIHEALERCRALWERELRAHRARSASLRSERTLPERVRLGVAARGLSIADEDGAPGGRVRLTLRSERPDELALLDVGSGDPVRLWRQDPDEAEVVRGVVTRAGRDALVVVVHADEVERLDEPGFRLDVDTPEDVFRRGASALDRAKRAEPAQRRVLEVLWGRRVPDARPAAIDAWFDPRLDDAQRDAVRWAVSDAEVAVVHGPPGTGKSTVLVEAVRQLVARGKRVLVSAPSNTAVDALAVAMADTGLRVVRLGHPARVHEKALAVTLDELLARSADAQLARGWMRQAAALRRKLGERRARGAGGGPEAREARAEVSRLQRDARERLAQLQEAALDRAQVVCTTCSGADARELGARTFDVAVVDEAAQALDPLLLIPALRARRLVLAGDPCQLPPVVIDPVAARDGLAIPRMERLVNEAPSIVRTLVVQHRMHDDIMGYPSHAMYQGRLVAADDVRGHRLDDLGALPDPLRPGAMVWIDTGARGWDEESDGDDPSVRNPGEGERVAAEVRRVLSRGVGADRVGVITPYAAQVRFLRDRLADEVARGLEIHSVDGFQGREKEVIVVSLVRSNEESRIGFLADVRRMNVALTRARRLLVVVGDRSTVDRHPWYRGFCAWCDDRDFTVSAWADEAEVLGETGG